MAGELPVRRQRVLVTGAGGFVGSHLCQALLDRGDEVIGVEGFIPSYPRRAKLANLAYLQYRQGFSLHDIDLRTAELDEIMVGVDTVVNLAAMPGLPRSWTEMELYTSCNLDAVQRLVDAARRAGVIKFVQASTSSVYGSQARGDETRPTRPISPYGVTKLAAEHLLLAHVSEHGFPVVILRYFSLYGPRQRPDMAYHVFIESMLAGTPLTVYGDGQQSRSNTYVADGVRGTMQAIDLGRVGEIYNIGGGVSLRLADVILQIADLLEVRPVVVTSDPRSGDQRHTLADTSKAEAHFGYRPGIDPEVGLREQVRWHLTEGPSRGRAGRHKLALRTP